MRIASSSDKPSGLLAVPGRGEAGRDCLSERVRADYADALVVHRLDMATSGLMLFARGPDAQRTLSIAFAQREVHKRYVAVVAGQLDPPEGEIDLPLLADWPNRPRQQVDARARQAVADALSRARDRRRCATRRASSSNPSPAARISCACICSPSATRSSATRCTRTADVQAAAPRLLLHASSLRFAHPASGAPVEFDARAVLAVGRRTRCCRKAVSADARRASRHPQPSPRLTFIQARVARPRAFHIDAWLLALEHAHRVAARLAQQLVVVAQAVGADAFAHRAAGLVVVPAVAEAALRRERLDVVEARGQRRLVDVRAQRAQPRRVDDAGAARQRDAASATVVVCLPRLSCSRTAPVSCTAAPSSVLVSVDLPAPDEPSTTSVWPWPR